MFLINLPDNPGELVQQWLEDARAQSGQANWNVMMLATVSDAGRPGVRAVLLKEHDPAAGTFTFFTNYRSRKARDIAANPHVAAAMYWDALERQIRIEGSTSKVSPEVSDAYFATRPRESQIGACASAQSEPVASYKDLLAHAQRLAAEYEGRPIPRPPHWGGYMITAHTIEFWHGRPGRIHERVNYTRAPEATAGWSRRWLNP
jgi:pyridoxamine 5'-phosphate oxidase